MDESESSQSRLSNTQTLRLQPKSDVPSFDEWINAVVAEVREQNGDAAFVFAAGCENIKWDEVFEQKPSRGSFDWDDIQPVETINHYASIVSNPAGDLYLCLQHENQAAYQRVINNLTEIQTNPIAAFKIGDNTIFLIRQGDHGRSFQQMTLASTMIVDFLACLEKS